MNLKDISSGDTIVLVPGIDGTALLFWRQIPRLAERFNVVSFPLPDDRTATMASLVDDLATVVSEVSPGRTLLLGESFGGALCMSTALARPDLVDGLVVINSFPWLEQRIQLALAPLAMKILPWAAMPTIRRLTESKIHSPHATAEDLAEFHERARHIGRRGYKRRLEILRHYDIRNDLTAIAAPTLFLAGSHDRLVPSTRWGEFMSERVEHSELQVLEGYGHVCLIDADLDLHGLVQPWWEKVIENRDVPG